MKILVSLLFVVSVSIEVFGWGQTGHRVVGQIASQHLSAKAKKKLKALLGQESLAMTGPWMDEVRSDSTYDYMTDWHWVTIETGETYDQSKKNPKGDVVMTLERVIAELKTHTLDKKKEIEYLKILIHLVGDIHQPLHVGCCDDQGGNKVKVKWFGRDTNLHSVWDSFMIDDTNLSFTELATSLGSPDKVTKTQWQKATVRDWANESMSYRTQLYAVGKGKLSYKYAYDNLPLVKLRLLQAGVRLGGILNQIYG